MVSLISAQHQCSLLLSCSIILHLLRVQTSDSRERERERERLDGINSVCCAVGISGFISTCPFMWQKFPPWFSRVVFLSACYWLQYFSWGEFSFANRIIMRIICVRFVCKILLVIGGLYLVRTVCPLTIPARLINMIVLWPSPYQVLV